MDNNINSSTSIKPYSVANPSFKGRNKKQLPTKSAEIKAKKKILGERNDTQDFVEQTSFESKSVRSPVIFEGDDDLENIIVGEPYEYDPVKNFLSPRPKFLMYNPNRNRRRNIINLQENDEDGVKISTYFDGDIPSSDSTHSCSQKEYEDLSNENQEDENGKEYDDDDDDDEGMDGFEEDRWWCLKGLLKFLFVVIAVMLTTQAICSMNDPIYAQIVESFSGFNDWLYYEHGLNFSEIGYVPKIMEPDLLVGRMKEGYGYDDHEILHMVENKERVEVQINETDDDVEVEDVHDLNQDVLIEEVDCDANEKNSQLINEERVVVQIGETDEILQEFDDVEAENVHGFNQVVLIEDVDSDANEKNSRLKSDDEFVTANDMEDELEKEAIDDIKNTDMLITLTSFDPTVAVFVVLSTLILTIFSIVYPLKCKKSSVSITTPIRQEDTKELEPSTNPPFFRQQQEAEPFVTSPSLCDVSKQISHVHAPTVELLGEVMFGQEVTSNISAEIDTSNSNSLIQTSTVSFSKTQSSHMELSTGDSYTVKKQWCKNAEVVTPSPVRRSHRLKNLSVMPT